MRKEENMRLSCEDYEKRLQSYSNETMELLFEAMTTHKKNRKMHEITTDSELGEEQVKEKLKELIEVQNYDYPYRIAAEVGINLEKYTHSKYDRVFYKNKKNVKEYLFGDKSYVLFDIDGVEFWTEKTHPKIISLHYFGFHYNTKNYQEITSVEIVEIEDDSSAILKVSDKNKKVIFNITIPNPLFLTDNPINIQMSACMLFRRN